MERAAEPWARVRDPRPIPAELDSGALRAAGAHEFAEMVRTHLVPRENFPQGRLRWSRLWQLLADHEDLAERAFDVLEEFLDVTEASLEREGLDDAAARRARKFKAQCEEAWRRLEPVDDGLPLAWAGRRARRYNPAARHVIAQLVDAIADHRAAVQEVGSPSEADAALWAVLRQLRLDPARTSPMGEA